MSKERRTVTLDPDVDQYLQREGVNASELVNKLVETHFTMGGDKQAMLEMRKQQLQSDMDELQSRLSTKKRELDEVESQLEDLRGDMQSVIEEAAKVIPEGTTSPDNDAVQNWANKAGISPEELLERLDEYR